MENCDNDITFIFKSQTEHNIVLYEYKCSDISQQRTGHMLLQYEKTVEAELEKRQDSYKQDM